MEPLLPLDTRVERHGHEASGFTTSLRPKDSQLLTVVDAWGISTEANKTSRDKARHSNEHCSHSPPTVSFRS